MKMNEECDPGPVGPAKEFYVYCIEEIWNL